MTTLLALREAAQAENNKAAFDAICAAEENARDTIEIEKAAEPDDFERLALDSICFTDPFASNSAVQSWFLAHGYRW